MYDKGIPLMERAISLSPFDVFWWHFPFWVRAFGSRDFDRALNYADKMAVPGLYWTYIHNVPTYAHLGQMDRAEDELATLLELRSYTVLSIGDYLRSWNYPEPVIELMIEGYQAAGLPESDSAASR